MNYDSRAIHSTSLFVTNNSFDAGSRYEGTSVRCDSSPKKASGESGGAPLGDSRPTEGLESVCAVVCPLPPSVPLSQFRSGCTRNAIHMSHHKKSRDARSSVPDSNRCAGKAEENGSQSQADHIRLRAYEISQSRNGGPGDELTDWIQAEHEFVDAGDTKPPRV